MALRKARSNTEVLPVVNELVDAVKPLENIHAGPGIKVTRTAGGVGISVLAAPVTGNKTTAPPDNCTGGTLATLGETEAWDRDTDDCPVAFDTVIVGYDTTEGEFWYKVRTITADKCGKLTAVSAFGSAQVFATVEVCTP